MRKMRAINGSSIAIFILVANFLTLATVTVQADKADDVAASPYETEILNHAQKANELILNIARNLRTIIDECREDVQKTLVKIYADAQNKEKPGEVLAGDQPQNQNQSQSNLAILASSQVHYGELEVLRTVSEFLLFLGPMGQIPQIFIRRFKYHQKLYNNILTLTFAVGEIEKNLELPKEVTDAHKEYSAMCKKEKEIYFELFNIQLVNILKHLSNHDDVDQGPQIWKKNLDVHGNQLQENPENPVLEHLIEKLSEIMYEFQDQREIVYRQPSSEFDFIEYYLTLTETRISMDEFRLKIIDILTAAANESEMDFHGDKIARNFSLALSNDAEFLAIPSEFYWNFGGMKMALIQAVNPNQKLYLHDLQQTQLALEKSLRELLLTMKRDVGLRPNLDFNAVSFSLTFLQGQAEPGKNEYFLGLRTWGVQDTLREIQSQLQNSIFKRDALKGDKKLDELFEKIQGALTTVINLFDELQRFELITRIF